MFTLLFFFSYPHIFYLSAHSLHVSFFFFFNDTATTEIYTLSLHDALPISQEDAGADGDACHQLGAREPGHGLAEHRSEEHTSELQSRPHLVCRLLLEKKKKTSELQSHPQLVCHLLLRTKALERYR